jgi:hypothetical protein
MKTIANNNRIRKSFNVVVEVVCRSKKCPADFHYRVCLVCHTPSLTHTLSFSFSRPSPPNLSPFPSLTFSLSLSRACQSGLLLVRVCPSPPWTPIGLLRPPRTIAAQATRPPQRSPTMPRPRPSSTTLRPESRLPPHIWARSMPLGKVRALRRALRPP